MNEKRDVSFLTEKERFNYRVCAVVVRDRMLLVMNDERFPYSYLPGGRVKFGERAQDAVCRELGEELGASARIIRPLWLNQAFFTEDVTKESYHEICLYFLVEADGLPSEPFVRVEEGKRLCFQWLPFEELSERYLYPEFIKKEIFSLPENLTLTEEFR